MNPKISMKHWLNRFAGFVLGVYGVILKITCRVCLHDDQRKAVQEKGYRYVFGTCHAYQISGLVSAEHRTGAMVSRSQDGDLVVPMLKWCGHVPIRGSSGTGKKGGGPALQSLIKHVLGGHSAMLAFDGPRGPRGEVQRGLAMLASKTHSAVFFVLGRASHRVVLKKTWDRLQIPLPFSRIDMYFSEPLFLDQNETLEEFNVRLQNAWNRLEAESDPDQSGIVDRVDEPTIRNAA
ncbi:MAG: DUF374 domain-containing protein [Rubripirellula sp.]|nr:DUF374 domain-containing protein [Rubripirellula sp.]